MSAWPTPRQIKRDLKKAGLNPKFMPGWKDPKFQANAGYSGIDVPLLGIVQHDTGTGVPLAKLRVDHSLAWIDHMVKNSRGEIVKACHFYIDRLGKLYVIYAGHTWHAGEGDAMLGWPENGANRYTMGTEIESSGGVKDFTPAQIATAIKLLAVQVGWVKAPKPIKTIINHKDYAGRKQGKVDTAYSKKFWRRQVRQELERQAAAAKPPTIFTPVKLGEKSARVVAVKQALGMKNRSPKLGRNCQRQIVRWQTRHGFKPTGALNRKQYRRLVKS